MLKSNATSGRSREALWNCLSHRIQESNFETYFSGATTQHWGSLHTDGDLIGFQDIRGIAVHSDESAFQYECQDLNADSVSKWLRQDVDRSGTQNRSKENTRILLGRQAMKNDGLRIFNQLPQVHVSALQLSKAMRIPRNIIDKMGIEESMSVRFPQPPDFSQLLTYAVTGCTVSCAWSYDAANNCTRALIVIRGSNQPEEDRLLHLLETLKDFSHYPGYLIYALIDIEVHHWSRLLVHFERGAAMNHHEVQRFLQGKFKNIDELYGEATMRIELLDIIPKYAPFVLEAAAQHRIYIADALSGSSEVDNRRYGPDRKALAEALEFRRQELEHLIERSNNLRRQTVTMLSTIMGLMSFNQQTSTSEIAKATKDDSTSMRTLSILAALYLPSTAISAIMAIPVFDWNAPKYSQLVSPRIWIFFIVTIPLTCITMAIFWYWVRLENSAPSVKGKRTKSHENAAKMV